MRAVLPLVLLLVLAVLAGCLSPDTPSPATSPSHQLTLLATNQLTQDDVAVEPSVAVGPEGTIYVTAPGSREREQDSRLWVSRDKGTTFEPITWADAESGVSNLPFGFEGDLAIDAAGTAYFVDLSFANTQLSSSADQGRTWLLQNPALFAAPVGDREWIAAGAAGTVVVSWNQIPSGYWLAVSTDGGRTFPTQTNLEGSHQGVGAGGFEVVRGGGAWAGVPALGPDGTIYAARMVDPIVSDDPEAWGPTLYRSTDGGETLTSHIVHPTANRTGWLFVVPAVDAAGNVYVAWAETDGNTTQAYYAASHDQGETWSAPVQVSHHGGSTAMPWLAASAEGHLALAFYGAPGASGDPDHVGSEAQWYPYVTEVRAAHTPSPEQASLQLSEAPVLEGPMCVGGLECNTGEQAGSRALGDYLEVAIGPDGHVHVVWTTLEQQVMWALVGG